MPNLVDKVIYHVLLFTEDGSLSLTQGTTDEDGPLADELKAIAVRHALRREVLL